MTAIIIYGCGKTGHSLQKLLQKQGKSALFYDDKIDNSLQPKFTANTTVLLSPGVKPDAKGMILAKKSGAKIVGELQYCWPLCKAPIVSVTGTNGKTTTCELVNHILQLAGKSTYLLGNGGVPFAEKVLECTPNDIVVLESSSFQLKDCNNFDPKVSVLTNLATDHLDYHKSMAEYSLAKQNNFVHQTADSYAIFNADDKNAVALSSKSNCIALFYSVQNEFANCYIKDDVVYLKLFGKTQSSPAKILTRMYLHNQSNCLCAMLACALFGVPLSTSVQAICSYKFPPHRMQIVGQFDGVTFVDDSKGTNVHATVSGCKNIVGRVALILGGSQKGYAFDEIFQNLPSGITYICATGQTAQSIAQSGRKYGKLVQIFDDIKHCVRASYQALKEFGGTVLMSNACASFDKFSNYAERGNYFQQVVEELKFESQV